jgi:hypothetical protein
MTRHLSDWSLTEELAMLVAVQDPGRRDDEFAQCNRFEQFHCAAEVESDHVRRIRHFPRHIRTDKTKFLKFIHARLQILFFYCKNCR